MTILRHITTQLLLLVLAVAVPLWGLIGYLIYADAKEAENQTIAGLREIAGEVAGDADVFLQRTVERLEFLSKRPAVRFADSAHCDPLIPELQRMNASLYSIIVVAGESGNAVCWSLDQSTAGASYADREWFRSGMKSAGFRAAMPVLGRFTGELVVPLTMPLVNDQGRTVGVLSIATSLREISRLVETRRHAMLNPLVTVASREGIVVARSLDSDKWLGKDARAIPAIAAQLAKKEGLERTIDTDDGARIFAYTTMASTGWVVAASIPVDAVTAVFRTKFVPGMLAAVLVTAVVLGIAFFWAQRIRKPIRSLADAAQAIGRGEAGTRALETGPIEIATVAREFNRMNEDRGRIEAEARVLAVSRYARNLIEASLDPLVTISAEGKITDVNEATVKVTGMSREQLVGTDFSDYFTEPEQASHGYREVFEKGFVTDYPLTIRHTSGRLTDVLYNAAVYRDEAGEMLGVFAAARDVTERKRSEAAARRLAAIVESSEDAIISATPDGRISTWNAGAERLYGYRAEEIIGQPMLTLVPPARANEENRILDRVRAGEHVNHYPTVRLRKDGSQIEVALTVSPVRNEAGTIVGISKTARDITEHKRLEREREQYFRFFTLSTDAMCIADPFGCFKQINPAFTRLTGFTESELVSKPFLEFVLPEDRERTADEMKRQVALRPSMNFENRYVRKDGSVVLLSWNAYFDRNDGVTYATARDITESKRADAKLRAAGLYARSLIEASLDPLVTISAEGKITDVNEATVKVTGVSREQLVGTDFSNYFTEPEQARSGYREVFEKGFVTDYPLTIRHATGRLTDVLYNATVYHDEEGAVLGVFAAARDITERKRASDAVKAERQRFYDVLETLPVYVVLITPDYHVPFANRFFRERFGEARGRRCYEYLFGRSDPCLICETFTVLKTNASHEWEWTGPDGRRYSIFDRSFRDVDGSPLILEMGIDISEQKQAEAEVRLLNATLEQRVRERTAQLDAANKELEAFSYSASHDLRAPLNTIDGFSRALQEDYGDRLDADGRDYLQRVRTASQRMAQLVDDLLKLSRMTRVDMVQEPVDLSVIAHTVVDELRASDPAREVAIDIAPDVQVRGDRRLLRVVLDNLLGNAWKFTAKHSRAKIEFGAAEREGERVYYVRDDGAGFDMAHIDKLFVPFQRLHAASEFPGNGVGLATVRRVVTRHGGRVWAEGRLEQGSTIYFTIPGAPLTKADATLESL